MRLDYRSGLQRGERELSGGISCLMGSNLSEISLVMEEKRRISVRAALNDPTRGKLDTCSAGGGSYLGAYLM